MIKIGFTGIPGCGKTALARETASSCMSFFSKIELVSEYARTYLSKHGSVEHMWEQYRIITKQLEWEESVSKHTDVLITDSPVHLTIAYTCDLPVQTEKEQMILNDIFGLCVKLNFPEPRYDLLFHLEPMIQPVKDGVRPKLHLDQEWRNKANIRLKAFADMFRAKKYIIINEPDFKLRVQLVKETIRKFLGKTI